MTEIEEPSLPPSGTALDGGGGDVTGKADVTAPATPAGVTLAGASEIVAGITEVVQAELDSLEEWAGQTEDVDVLMVIRAGLESQRKAVAGAIAATDRRLLALTDKGEVVATPGAGQMIHRIGSKKVTHGRQLARAIASRIADTPADSDGVALPPGELCRLTADGVVDAFGCDNASATFRAKTVEKLGLRPGDYVSHEEGDAKVQFIP